MNRDVDLEKRKKTICTVLKFPFEITLFFFFNPLHKSEDCHMYIYDGVKLNEIGSNFTALKSFLFLKNSTKFELEGIHLSWLTLSNAQCWVIYYFRSGKITHEVKPEL